MSFVLGNCVPHTVYKLLMYTKFTPRVRDEESPNTGIEKSRQNGSG